jgi:molybdopterin-biosynthesis enzyme MoeA-like protein
MHIGILIIGDEILTGRRRDQHFAHVIEALSVRGLELAWSRYVGDDEKLLTRQFCEIKTSGDLCFSFGGIGATLDDRTRQAIACAFGVALSRHPDAVKAIEMRFGASAYPHRIMMADLPKGAELIPNPYNNVPGFSLEHIHCLPGFPEMAWPMLEWVLDTRYTDIPGVSNVQLTLLIPNSHESELIEIMDALHAQYPRVKISCLPRFLPQGGTEVELGIRGAHAESHVAFEALQTALTDSNRIFRTIP